MKRFMTPFDIANTIRMMRPVFSGTIVVVEGNSDARVYCRFFNETFCRVIPAHGKNNALIVMASLGKDGFMGILAIIDSDYSKLNEIDMSSPDILVTDTHDLETMIISSKALDNVLSEFGEPAKIRRLGKPVRKVLLKAAMPLGYLRWISSSKQDNLSLRFKYIVYENVFDIRNRKLKMNIDSMLQEVSRFSHNSRFDRRDLKIRIQKLLQSNKHDPWHVCRGHDMVHILTIGLRKVFGSKNAKTITYEQVDRIIRIAFGYTEFARTQLYKAIEQWEKTHPDFRVLN